jgi:hypothetical protein
MNNVHERAPVVFETRWALSYLRGPLTRSQIQTLMADRRAPAEAEQKGDETPALPARPEPAAEPVEGGKPSPPGGVPEIFLPVEQVGEGELIYRPMLFADASMHVVRKTYELDCTRRFGLLVGVDAAAKSVWDQCECVDPDSLAAETDSIDGAKFEPLPAAMQAADSYSRWSTAAVDYLRTEQPIVSWGCKALRKFSDGKETEGEFRVRMGQLAAEERAREIEAFRARHADDAAKIKDAMQRAEKALRKEKSERNQGMFESALSWGAAIVGILGGRKGISQADVKRVSQPTKATGKVFKEASDVGEAQAAINELEEKRQHLDAELTQEIEQIRQKFDVEQMEFESREVRPQKAECEVARLGVAWVPCFAEADEVAANERG